MGTEAVTYYGNYTPVGDVLVLAVCLTFAILIRAAYVNRTKSFTIFRRMLIFLVCAAVANMLHHIFLNQIGTIPIATVYLMRVVYHACLFAHMMLYILYMTEILHLDRSESRLYIHAGWTGYIFMVGFEITGIVVGFGYRIENAEEIYGGFNVFALGYVVYLAFLFIMCFRYRTRVYRQILVGAVATCALSFLILAIQGRHNQSSFTTASFLFPALALLYLVHANPYDIDIGAVNVSGFDNLIAFSYQKKKELLLMSLLIPEYDNGGKKYPKEIQEVIRHFTSHFFRHTVLFQVSSGRMILSIPIDKNPDYEKISREMLDVFFREYERYSLDYKITITRTEEELSEKNEYLGLIRHVEKQEHINSVHWIDEKDVEGYRRYRYIVHELEDIHAKRDLNDPRVEVFCQPVLNLRTEKYDTAEALMRLRLEKIGMVFPDQFIPVAEQFNYITVLSMIILAKTCAQIRTLMENGYFVRRISVNFSMIDLRDPHFSEIVNGIIRDSGIPYEKVAIELTESQNEQDFNLVKERINELKDSGMKFYLDDFGTGYSSFERIMELPFDIIKFDRSLVIASSSDIKSETMVSYLAHMFSDMNYAVLYEGVENEADEERCGRMCARYLQGYKYSKPIPIEKLTDFFEKGTGEDTEGNDGVIPDMQSLLDKYGTT